MEMTDALLLEAFADSIEEGTPLKGETPVMSLRRIAGRLRAVDTLKDEIDTALETLTKIKRL